MRLEASGGNNRSELPLPLAGRAIAYGIFNESSLRTQGPIRRGLSFRHWSRGLFSLLRPGVMGPCVRRDDPLRDRARTRLYKRTAEVGHMRYPSPQRGGI